MTETQKLIKYLAIALAVLLIVNIFYGLFGVVSNIFAFSTPKESLELKQETISDNINNLDIDLKFSKLIFKTDNEFKVATNNEYVSVKTNNNKITIEEKNKLFSSKNNEVIIYIPDNKVFQIVAIEAGSGTIDVTQLNVNNLELDLGAGAINIEDLNVYTRADIDSGAGKFEVKSGNISNLDLDMGIGEVIINGNLTGNNDIDAGVGSLELNLASSINNYKFVINKGIGEIKINNEKVDNNYQYNLGSNIVNIDGGIGSINVYTLEGR